MTALNELYAIGNAIDTYALGHYARVYEAHDKRANRTVAFKIMRREHLVEDDQPSMEAMAFINEADLLTRLADLLPVMDMFDCGYVQSTDENPRETLRDSNKDARENPRAGAAQVESYGLNVERFRQGAFRFAGQGWRPYLALEMLPRSENLLYLMKPNTPGQRWRLPTEECIDLAYQFTNVLIKAHQQKIVYLDHKLEHVYWNGRTLKIIDWNSSRLLQNSPHVLTQKVVDDIHNLCVGILYPIFTGLSPQKGSLVPQPADQAGVESRYSEVRSLDFGVEPTLSKAIQDMLQAGALRQFNTADEFIKALDKVAVMFGWDSGWARGSTRDVRTKTREALAKLREGQDAIRDARDMLRDAAILEDINDDIEAELKRLLTRLNDMLNYRVIP
jgi:serine/threonine protein kinase